MGKIESVVKSEIVRLTKKELRAVCGPLARDVRELKRTASQLRKTVASLKRVAGEYVKESRAQKSQLKASDEEIKQARISGGLIKKLRKRLAISQGQLARLVGVSATAVAFWEQGRARPAKKNLPAIVALRKLGKREVRDILAEKAAAQPKKKAKKKRKKKAKRKTAKKKTAKRKVAKKKVAKKKAKKKSKKRK